MQKSVPRNKNSEITTIQVKKELKNQLDILKILGNYEDLNSLLSTLSEFYISKNKISIDPKVEEFLKRLRR